MCFGGGQGTFHVNMLMGHVVRGGWEIRDGEPIKSRIGAHWKYFLLSERISHNPYDLIDTTCLVSGGH